MSDLYKVKVQYRFSPQETSDNRKIVEMLIPIYDIKEIRTAEAEELIRSNIIALHQDILDIKPEDICIDLLSTEWEVIKA